MSKKTLLLLGFILAKFYIQFTLIDPAFDLHRDEYLHLDQAKHLAWGYLSVPPVTSWISYLILLLGNGVFWVKFFPALFGALTLFVVWKTIEELKGTVFSLLLGGIAILFSTLLRMNILYQPNSLDILLWTTFYFLVLKYVNSEKVSWMYWASVVFAIGFLNKYNFIFLIIGLLLAMLLTQHRKLFANRHLYFAAALGLVLIIPNLIWQYQNHFPVFHHLEELSRTQLVNVDRGDFIKEQILFFIGSIFVIISGFIAVLVYKPFQKFRVFLWAFVFTLGLYIYLKAKAYYAIGLYPFWIAPGAVYLRFLLSKGWKRYLKPVSIAIPLLFAVLIFRIAFPNKSPQEMEQQKERYQKLGMLRWEDGKEHALPQDFADMLGWKELARKTDSLHATLPEQEHTLILCDNYGQAGAINFYSKNKDSNAVSFNADYINWFDLSRPIDNIILVKELKNKEEGVTQAQSFFQTVYVGDSITNPRAREKGTTIYVLRKPKTNVAQSLKKEINKIKSAT